MENQILYKKVGKKYQEVQIHNAWEYFMEGTYLVVVDGNSRAMYSSVTPAKVELQCAYKMLSNQVADVIRDGLKMHPAKETVTKKQKAAWEAFEAAMGKDGYNVMYKSIQEIVDNVEKVIMGGFVYEHRL